MEDEYWHQSSTSTCRIHRQNTYKTHIHMKMGKRMGGWMKVALISTALRDAPNSLMVTRPELVWHLVFLTWNFLILAQLWEAIKLTLKNVPPQHHSRNERETKVIMANIPSCAFFYMVTMERPTQYLSLTSWNLHKAASQGSKDQK